MADRPDNPDAPSFVDRPGEPDPWPEPDIALDDELVRYAGEGGNNGNNDEDENDDDEDAVDNGHGDKELAKDLQGLEVDEPDPSVKEALDHARNNSR